MKGLSWEAFQEKAEATICRGCECGATRPWRGNPSCIQAWLRFHSSRGIILSCNASTYESSAGRIEDSLMATHVRAPGAALEPGTI